MRTARTHDALDVLLRSGPARTAFLAEVASGDETSSVDAMLVSDVLRSARRVGQTVETRAALVDLCAILRALDAALDGRIDPVELRRGLELHSARTDRFAAFHDARILLRTLEEVLDGGRVELDGPIRAQVAFLDRDLRGWVIDQLLGEGGSLVSPSGPAGDSGIDPREPFRVADPARRAFDHALVEELLHGSSYGPVTGLLGAAWIRDWVAVPVPGERFGESGDELSRLLEAVAGLDAAPDMLVQVDRTPSPRWRIEGGAIHVGDGLRPGWDIPATVDGLRLAFHDDRRGWSILTTRDLAFAIVEAPGHHAVLGPRSFVEQASGMSALEAIARFRDHVEALATADEDPPEDLLEVARSFGRFRRRSR